MASGIDVRHRQACPAREGRRCKCKPAFQGHVWSRRDRKRVRKTFDSMQEAKAWRRDAQRALDLGTMRAPSRVTLREAARAFIEGGKDGAIRNRSGDRYKPSTLRGYDEALTLRVLPDLGALRLSEVRRPDLQALVERMQGDGANPSTIRNTLLPLRAIFRREANRGTVAVNPTRGLELPAVRGTRDRIADPREAAALLAALPDKDRALWATAVYAGLRMGELRALRWEDVDLPGGVVRVERAWDAREGIIEPKSRAGRRSVPIPSDLRASLTAHKLRSGRHVGLVFGRNSDRPFNPSTVYSRAYRAWEAAGAEAITLHECRHTFASMMIAAGVNAKALCTFMGHEGIKVTIDRYGHLMPGHEAEAASLLDAYLTAARSV